MFMGKMKSSAYFTGKDEEYYNGDSAASKRRRSFELMYNPQNHMRRRELTEVLDMHRCHGCGLRFGTISLLERHIRVCKHKEKIKEMHSVKTTVTSRRIHKRPKDTFVRDAHKQKCRYCDKLFTYIGMLKKHVLDICPVRREYFEHGNADHIDKVWEDTIICVGGSLMANSNSCNMNTKESFTPDNMSDVSEDSKAGRKRKGRGRRKNRKWGNQNKTRRQSPDNVKIGNCSYDDGQTPPKSPESGNNENSIKEEGDSDDTESGAICEIVYKQDENEWPKDRDETGTEVAEMAAESHVCDNGPNVVGSVGTKETLLCEENSAACDHEEEVKSEQGKDRKEREADSSEFPERYTKEISETELSAKVPELNVNNSVKSLPLHLKPDGVPMSVTTTTKPLFDLDSTIARLKERTNVMNKEEKDLAQQNLEPTASPDKIQKKVKGWKKAKTRELDEPSKIKRTKQLTPKESLENTEKSSQKEQKRSESRDSQKNVTPKKEMNGEATLTKSLNGSQLIPVVKSGVKRGRKPKAILKKSPTIETLNKRNTKLSENSVLLDKNPIGQGENYFENSTKKSTSKKSPKGQGKNIKKNKIDEINVVPVVNMTSSADSEGLGEEGIRKSRKGGRKKQNDLENNLSDLQVPKELKCPDENIPNGIIEEKEPSPVKGKRGPKKRKVVDHSVADQFDSKITPNNKKSTRIKTTEQNRNISGNSNEELATAPPKRAKKSVIKEPTSVTNGGGKVSPKLYGTDKKIKIGSQKRKLAKDTSDSLVPDNISVRASSRSTSRSTSRSRSRSVQREITPPPTAKKAKSVSSVQNAKRQVEARTKKSSNQKVNKAKAKQPVVKGNNTSTGTRKSMVTNNAKNTPFKGRGRTNNNR